MTKPKRLPDAQRNALQGARDHGSPTHGLSGRSAYGGFAGTERALRREGWLDREFSITELGRWRLAIDLGEIPADTPPPDPEATTPRP